MPEFVVVETSEDESLQDFSRYLWQQKMPHRLLHKNNKQYLLVGSEADAKQVMAVYQQFKAGNTEMPTVEHHVPINSSFSISRLFQFPVTSLFLVLSVLGFLIVYFNDRQLISLLLYFDIKQTGFEWQAYLSDGQYWRFFTPMFLHFGFLHIVFNGLWLWDLGRRFEFVMGSFTTFAVIMFIAMGSNITQFVFSGSNRFGGMSGVIYGLLGFAWMWGLLCPKRSMQIPQSVINFMLVWMVVCFAGFTELVGLGAVANAAHVGGLVIGVLFGVAAGLIHNMKASNSL